VNFFTTCLGRLEVYLTEIREIGEKTKAKIKPTISAKAKIIFNQNILVLAKLKKVLGLNIPNI